MGDIERDGVRIAKQDRRRLPAKSLLTLAASLLVLASLWWLVPHAEKSLYAQALAATQRARTIHQVTRVIPAEGQPPQIAAEAWFERDIGFRVELPDEVRVGDDAHVWTYRKKEGLAVRSDSKGIREAIDRELDLKRMLEDFKDFGYERYPEGDQRSTATRCRLTCYEHASFLWGLFVEFLNHRDPTVAGRIEGFAALLAPALVVPT